VVADYRDRPRARPYRAITTSRPVERPGSGAAMRQKVRTTSSRLIKFLSGTTGEINGENENELRETAKASPTATIEKWRAASNFEVVENRLTVITPAYSA